MLEKQNRNGQSTPMGIVQQEDTIHKGSTLGTYRPCGQKCSILQTQLCTRFTKRF